MTNESTTAENIATGGRSRLERMVSCDCDLRTRLVGDGCPTCNPKYWAWHEAENKGAEARHQGYVRHENPFAGTEYERAWESGWDDQDEDIRCS